MRQRTLNVVLLACETAMSIGILWCLVLFELGHWGVSNALTFVPQAQLAGVGLGREAMTEAGFAERTEQMIEAQRFGILRSPQAETCAERIQALEPVFARAARESGFSQATLEAMAWVESCGDARAQSPTGPRGIMQFTRATAKQAGLKIFSERRYAKEKVWKWKGRGKKRKKIAVWVKKPYTYEVDERLDAEKSIRAAARYLSRLAQKFGGEDLAVFAYHCGEGCVSDLVEKGRKAFASKVTMPNLFFGNHPDRNKAIYRSLQYHMERDWSPTYWFRVKQAERLFALYRQDPAGFRKLWRSYRRNTNGAGNVPNRMWALLSPEDIVYETLSDLQAQAGKDLAPTLDDPGYFGYNLRTSGAGPIAEKDLENQQWYLQNSPAANGALLYIAYETRRLHAATHPFERWVSLDITALVRTLEYQRMLQDGNVNARTSFPTHCTGWAFDCSYVRLPKGERESLRFVLDDLEYAGMLTFIEEVKGSRTFHVVAAPAAREFFTQVYEQARKEHATRTNK